MSAIGQTGRFLPFRLVVAVASLGGLSTVSRLVAGLPGSFPVPFLLVQHRSPGDVDERYRSLLDRHSALPVHVAQAGSTISSGITLMPAGTLVNLDADLRYQIVPAPTAIHRCHAGDLLFSSCASSLGPAAIGVVLTGNMADGTEGARSIKRAGGRVLAEDPRTAQAPSMPTNAIATGCVDHVLPLSAISAALIAFTMAAGAAELFTVPTPAWARLTA